MGRWTWPALTLTWTIAAIEAFLESLPGRREDGES